MAAVRAHRELVLTRQEGGEGLDWEEEPVPPPWALHGGRGGPSVSPDVQNGGTGAVPASCSYPFVQLQPQPARSSSARKERVPRVGHGHGERTYPGSPSRAWCDRGVRRCGLTRSRGEA